MPTQLVYYRYGVEYTESYDSRVEAIDAGSRMMDEGSAYVESIVENGVKTDFDEIYGWAELDDDE
jgi:hypothetical protein